MGNNIRIGKDFNVQWTINKVVDGERLPYDLVGKELQLYIVNDNGRKEVAGWKVQGNVIEWTFLGKDQRRLGAYQLILVENAGKEGMVTVDTCKAFNLVEHSCNENVDGSSDVVVKTVVLESEVALAPVVKEIGGGAYDDTELRNAIADLQQKDTQTDAKLTELSAEIIMLDGIKDVLRNQSIYNTNGATRTDNGYYITPYIPVTSADYIGFVISSSITSKYLILYDKDYNVLDYYGLYADKTKIALSIYPSVAYVRMTFKEGEGGSLSINGVVIWDNNKVDFSNVYTKNSDLILAWIITEAFTASNIVRDTDGNVKSLDVTWCDGEQGKMTLTRDADGNATSVTATYYGKTYVLTITRDSEGNVISTNIE